MLFTKGNNKGFRGYFEIDCHTLKAFLCVDFIIIINNAIIEPSFSSQNKRDTIKMSKTQTILERLNLRTVFDAFLARDKIIIS